MLGLKVQKEEGEETRRRLLATNVLLTTHKIKRGKDYLVFPLRKEVEGEMVDEEFEELPPKKKSLREVVSGLRAYDVIGDIAIVEIPEELASQKKIIGETILSLNKNVRCVFEKRGGIAGLHRRRGLGHIAGEKRSKTVHREYGCRFALDVRKVFFSPRLATERKRIAGLVRPKEKVLDMFCGVGPFSIVVSKHSRAKEIHASDINGTAIDYLKKNISLNKAKNVFPYREDARRIFHVVGDVDRCIMNLPKKSFEFLDIALRHSRFIHFYTISESMKGAVERMGVMGIGVISTRKIKEYSPRESIICLDLNSKAY